jgi:hypothetical protein
MIPAMASDAKARPKAHPLRPSMWFIVLMACGGLYALYTSGAAWELWNLPIILMLVLMLLSGLWLRGATISVPRLNRAIDAYGRADFAEARAILEEADRASRARYVTRVVDLQRAEIAWALGDLNSARAFVELAATRAVGRLATKMHDGSALSLRALVRAARSESDQARVDIERIRTHPAPLPSALGRAELAEAIVLAKMGDRAALERHLEKNRAVMRHVAPRERAIARVLERFALGVDPPPIRAEAPLARACGEVPSLSTWMAKVLPLDLPPATEPDVAAPPMQAMEGDAQVPVQPASGRAVRNFAPVVALYMLLILMFLAIWQFFQGHDPARPTGADRDEPAEETR